MTFKLFKSLPYMLMFLSSSFTCISLAHADEKAVNDVSRGRLLYSLHCASCHTEQKHWRENKKVTDWPSLISQVSLWQNISNLKWDYQDIEIVAKHLNSLYYHYPQPNTVARKK